MNSLKVIVDEIRASIKQTFDDKKVSRAQVVHWVIIVANKLLGKHVFNRDSGAFLVQYFVDVQTDGKRKFIEVPADLFDFDRDGGIEYMAYYNDDAQCLPQYRYKTITRTTPSQAQWLEMDKNTKPSAAAPYFWRRGDIIEILGIENVPIKKIELGIYQTIDPVEKIDIDAEFRFPAELLEHLKRQVTDLARYSFLFPSDNSNDGSDTASDPQSKNIPKISSVNQAEE
jgi:hypothetical protein